MSDNKKVIRKVKKVKEEGEPSKPKSSYLLFCMEERQNIEKENESKADDAKLKHKDIIRELGSRWRNLKETDPSRVESYENLAKNDKERYDKEKESWKQSKLNVVETVAAVEEKKTKKAAPAKKKKEEAVAAPVPVVEKKKSGGKKKKEEVVVVEEEIVLTEDQLAAPQEKPKKKGANSFINFMNKNRENFKKANPTVPSKEISAKMSEIWKGLSDAEKAEYK